MNGVEPFSNVAAAGPWPLGNALPHAREPVLRGFSEGGPVLRSFSEGGTSPLKTRVRGFRQPPSGRFPHRCHPRSTIATGSTQRTGIGCASTYAVAVANCNYSIPNVPGLE